jgi:hypothetical protein
VNIGPVQWNETYGKAKTIQGLSPETCEICSALYKKLSRVEGFTAKNKIDVSLYTISVHDQVDYQTCVVQASGVRVPFVQLLT